LRSSDEKVATGEEASVQSFKSFAFGMLEVVQDKLLELLEE